MAADPITRISLDEALDQTRTGDLWVFRGRTVADRAIQLTTNSPVNHVGMCLALEDLPPLMWHAELGRSLPDLWAGGHHRGVQLHDLRAAVLQWAHRYGQRAWLRQLDRPLSTPMEDAALRTVARLDGTPFPSTARLAARWFGGRIPAWHARRREHVRRDADPGMPELAGGPVRDQGGAASGRPALESAYCAEVVAITYQAMGLLPPGRRPNWYDPGRFWSGDELELAPGYRLGAEIAVELPPAPAAHEGTCSADLNR
ncbi:MAG TPA: hypothetical protein VFP72_03375 [Kineosporiaceae bacterium]|nr:hypothetical protein [Kineosporiaceae bacterium]